MLCSNWRMQLAFDRPTVITKDDKTDYSFDTGIIEHVTYPRDLRFNRMVTFKSQLTTKVLATYRAGKDNPDHSTFLKSFGKFHVANLQQDVVPADKLVVEMITNLQEDVSQLRRSLPRELERQARTPEKSFEGTLRIAVELGKFLAQNPKSTLRELLDSDDFPNTMEGRCEPWKYGFGSQREFREALEKIGSDLWEAHRKP